MSQSDTRSFFSHGMAKWGLFIFALFALWFGGWFVAANYADGKVGETIETIAGRGIEIDCGNREITGFPFRLGVNCDTIDVTNRNNGMNLKSGTLRTAAQLYAPGKMVGELDAPFEMVSNGQTITANWSRMRAFLDANFSGGFDLVSLNFSDLDITSNGTKLLIGKGALHSRPSPANDTAASDTALDVAIDLKQIQSTDDKAKRLPKLDLYVDARLEDGYRDLVVARLPLKEALRDGASGNIRSIRVSVAGGGTLVVSGPLQLGSDGLLSGEIRVGMAKPGEVAKAFADVDPVLRDVLLNLGNALNMMGKKTKIGSQGIRTVPIKLKNGEARLGFIRIARIPPLRF